MRQTEKISRFLAKKKEESMLGGTTKNINTKKALMISNILISKQGKIKPEKNDRKYIVTEENDTDEEKNLTSDIAKFKKIDNEYGNKSSLIIGR